MYIERDLEFDQVYVNFAGTTAAGAAEETREVLPGSYLDLDAQGRLIGIEVVDAARTIGTSVAEIGSASE